MLFLSICSSQSHSTLHADTLMYRATVLTPQTTSATASTMAPPSKIASPSVEASSVAPLDDDNTAFTKIVWKARPSEGPPRQVHSPPNLSLVIDNRSPGCRGGTVFDAISGTAQCCHHVYEMRNQYALLRPCLSVRSHRRVWVDRGGARLSQSHSRKPFLTSLTRPSRTPLACVPRSRPFSPASPAFLNPSPRWAQVEICGSWTQFKTRHPLQRYSRRPRLPALAFFPRSLVGGGLHCSPHLILLTRPPNPPAPNPSQAQKHSRPESVMGPSLSWSQSMLGRMFSWGGGAGCLVGGGRTTGSSRF